MIEIQCTNCRNPYPQSEIPYHCSRCGGLFDYINPIEYSTAKIEKRLPGIWQYRHTFGLETNAPVTSLGEGNTPLVWFRAFDKQVAAKLEFLNPTGSFKDRGTAVLTSFLKFRLVNAALEDSSGNAGASFAAYSALAEIEATIFVPSYASGPKRLQIESYGANVIPIDGPRSKASEAVRTKASHGSIYASHAYMPFGLRGFATVAYELQEQIGETPGTVILPVGEGTLLLGIGRGFKALHQSGISDHIPRLVGVQALACAPLWAVHKYGSAGLGFVTEGDTLAEGIRIKNPLRGDKILNEVSDSGGLFVSVEEEEIGRGYKELAAKGFYVEKTSSVVWDALSQVVDEAQEPIVLILTGSGLKNG